MALSLLCFFSFIDGTELVNEVEPKEAHTENASDVGVDTTNADDCMPAEYLVSDDSDVAGRYSVTEAAMASTSAAAASGGSYQRLDISSHSSSSRYPSALIRPVSFDWTPLRLRA